MIKKIFKGEYVWLKIFKVLTSEMYKRNGFYITVMDIVIFVGSWVFVLCFLRWCLSHRSPPHPMLVCSSNHKGLAWFSPPSIHTSLIHCLTHKPLTDRGQLILYSLNKYYNTHSEVYEMENLGFSPRHHGLSTRGPKTTAPRRIRHALLIFTCYEV